jgi:hypothetical protein
MKTISLLSLFFCSAAHASTGCGTVTKLAVTAHDNAAPRLAFSLSDGMNYTFDAQTGTAGDGALDFVDPTIAAMSAMLSTAYVNKVQVCFNTGTSELSYK